MSFPSYPHAKEVAGLLLESGCIKFADQELFEFTSGWRSPVYVNMRGILGPVSIRQRLMAHASACLRESGVLDSVDVIAGGETAGIPYAAILADMLNKDFAYIRKAPKGFGMKGRIEGADVTGRQVLLVEDLTTEGSSKVNFAASLREAEATVDTIFSSFWYGFEAQTQKAMDKAALSLLHLCTWRDLLALQQERGALSDQQVANVEAFLSDPDGWHGG